MGSLYVLIHLLPVYPSFYLFDNLWIHMVTAFILKSVYHPQFSSVQSLSCVWLFATPWTAAFQAPLSIISSWSLIKLMSIELATHPAISTAPTISTGRYFLFQRGSEYPGDTLFKQCPLPFLAQVSSFSMSGKSSRPYTAWALCIVRLQMLLSLITL